MNAVETRSDIMLLEARTATATINRRDAVRTLCCINYYLSGTSHSAF